MSGRMQRVWKDKFLTYCGLQKQKKRHKNLSCVRRYLPGIRKKYFVNTSEYYEPRILNVCFIYTLTTNMHSLRYWNSLRLKCNIYIYIYIYIYTQSL